MYYFEKIIYTNLALEVFYPSYLVEVALVAVAKVDQLGDHLVDRLVDRLVDHLGDHLVDRLVDHLVEHLEVLQEDHPAASCDSVHLRLV